MIQLSYQEVRTQLLFDVQRGCLPGRDKATLPNQYERLLRQDATGFRI